MNFNEFITLEEAADKEEEIRKKFGRVLFGDWQRSERLTKRIEKDTKYEKKIFSLIYNEWFWNNTWASAKKNNKVLQTLKELSEIKDNYPTILKPDPVSKYPILYRALIVKRTDEDLRKFHKKLFTQRKNYEIVDKKFGRVIYKLGEEAHQYKPKKEAESWTISFKHAFKFIRSVDTNYGTDYFNAGKPFIIYAAKVPEEERLFKLKFTNTLFETPEYEIVRLSNNPIKASMYYIIRKEELGDDGEDVHEI